jgi:hypothetical protein
VVFNRSKKSLVLRLKLDRELMSRLRFSIGVLALNLMLI